MDSNINYFIKNCKIFVKCTNWPGTYWLRSPHLNERCKLWLIKYKNIQQIKLSKSLYDTKLHINTSN